MHFGLLGACGLLVAAGIGPAAGAPRTFLDAGQWLNAVAGLPNPSLTLSPEIGPQNLVMADGLGQWTVDNPLTTVDVGGQSLTVSRLAAFQFLPSGPPPPPVFSQGSFFIPFLCDFRYTQCIGLQTLEVTFPEEIIGFGGDLQITYWMNIGVPLFALAATAAQPIPPQHQVCIICRYDGFFGVVFDAPIKTLRLDWFGGAQSHSAPDQATYVQFSNTFVVKVNEPAAAFVFGGALAVLWASTLFGRRLIPNVAFKQKSFLSAR